MKKNKGQENKKQRSKKENNCFLSMIEYNKLHSILAKGVGFGYFQHDKV